MDTTKTSMGYMSLINKLIPEEDKLKHFYVGFLILLVLKILQLKISFSDWYILYVLIIIGVSKEIFDYYNNGNAEVLDVLFTILPFAILLLSKINFQSL